MRNVARLLLDRELGRAGREPCTAALAAWSEADFAAGNASATYAAFQPPPRSTIALSYNCDGSLLASTHGDHTVKLSCCATGKLTRVLSGHRRTPWVVRFHPRKPTLLASGSLDHEVRLWDASTGQCIARHTFGKPIASLAFHVCADVLAIGCGHKLYMWEYAAQGKLPVIVLKTRRSMRAVHFHPHGLPIVLTAEVQDPSPTPELPATLTEAGPYLQQQQPPDPAAAGWEQAAEQRAAAAGPPPSREVPIPSAQLLQGTSSRQADGGQQQQQQQAVQQHLGALGSAGAASGPPAAAGVYVATADGPVPVEQLTGVQPLAHPVPLDLPVAALALSAPLHQLHLRSGTSSPAPVGGSEAAAAAAGGERQQGVAAGWNRPGAPGWVPPGSAQLPPSMVPTGWELPFPSSLFTGGQQQPVPGVPAAGPGGAGAGAAAADAAGNWAATAASLPQVMAAFSAAAWNIIGEEQPPRVRLRMWRFDASRPTALLAVMGAEQASGNLKLQISDAVLCSEMGVHFSPCGRYLAATTACRGPLPAVGVPGSGLLPEAEDDSPSQQEIDAALAAALGGNPLHADALLTRHGLAPPHHDALPPALRASGAASELLERSSSAAAAASALGPAAAVAAAAAAAEAQQQQQRPERVVFEVRVYSIEGPNLGEVMRAKRIRAAHCLTSVQFSPCCNHMLLAYGKKHISLLRSLVADRGAVVPLHTILEVFRLQDMELVRVLPSADDEINAACFHPRSAGGIAYGTKEGRLRIIAHDRSHLAEDDSASSSGSSAAAGRSSIGSANSSAAAGGHVGAGGDEEHPTQRELDNLREWVLTQQWLQRQALGDAGGAAAAAAAGGGTAQRLQAMQQLWEQGGGGGGRV